MKHLPAALLSLLFATAARADERPDVVVFLADDLGWRDVGFNGCTDIPTPNLDKIAASGAVLTSFYVEQLCTPSRAALLTGRYPIRYGLQQGALRPNARYGLPLAERTLPLALREAGYTTAIVGKWHLGEFDPAYLPTRRGFDLQYGGWLGDLDYVTHMHGDVHDWYRNDQPCQDEGYSTRLLAKEAVRIVREQPLDRPLFLYVAFNAVHAPYHFAPGREHDFPGLPFVRREYATMVDEMDRAVGEVVAALEKTGRRDRTLIFFSSDNGPGEGPGDNGPFRGAKSSPYEGGHRAAACVAWKGRIPAGATIAEPLHLIDWFPTIAAAAGVPLDAEHQPRPLDGRDLLPVVAAGAKSPHDALLLQEDMRSSALRSGKWKVVMQRAVGSRRGVTEDKTELFDVVADPGERTDLSAQEPEVLAQLAAKLEQFRKEAVAPHGDPTGANPGK